MSGSDAQHDGDRRREERRRLRAQRLEELHHQRPARRLHRRVRGDRAATPARRKHTAFVVPTDTPGFTARAARREARHPRRALVHGLLRERAARSRARARRRSAAASRSRWRTLDGGRIGIASQALGIARAAFEKAVAYSKERKAFGGPIAEPAGDPVHARRHGDRARRRAPAHAARRVAEGPETCATRSRAPRPSSTRPRCRTRVTHKAIQIHGGYGYTTEFDVERHYRDARITEIYEGTSEIQRIVIAQSVLKR